MKTPEEIIQLIDEKIVENKKMLKKYSGKSNVFTAEYKYNLYLLKQIRKEILK